MFDSYTSYEECIPAGVLLPTINISKEQYESVGLKDGASNFMFLKKICESGAKLKGIDLLKDKLGYRDRLSSELSILKRLGFIDYILLNWDILNFCHENDIPTGPGRGSAAGSLVLFFIGVTKIDPIKYDLFFERFVSESRAKKIKKDGVTYLDGSLLADIDNDISYEHRDRVVSYIENRYPNRTAKILTLNTLSSKLCIRECGKIVGNFIEQDINHITSFIPKNFGKVASIDKSLEESTKFKEWSEDNTRVVDISRKLEGLNKNSGVHPSGIAISCDAIEEICPVQKTNDGSLVTGYDMNWVSELMVKFDILGLRTLSVIYNTCNSIGIDPTEIPLDEDKTYYPFSELDSPHGLFQIEAHTNFSVCRKVKPRSLEELSAVIALARPGALDFVDKYSDYIRSGDAQVVHNFFEEELSYTGGIPLYQEQLMKMAVRLGFTLDESEQLRRIVGKKKVDKMPEWKSKIEGKIQEQNLEEAIGDILWKVAEDSANYSFNKSHSISYATLAAWTVYLKFNHPKEFFLALLKMTNFEPNPQLEVSNISKELPNFDIKLLPPNLVKSDFDYCVEEGNIRYGLSSIKGISDKTLHAIQLFKEEKFVNKFEVFIAAKHSGLNIGTLSSLIQAGALSDSQNEDRAKQVLEAQLFNILTDREKRNFISIHEKEDKDVFEIFNSAKTSGFKYSGDDGKPLIKESRYETIKKKYLPQKEIYYKNSKNQKFANWYFERSLLGFSYSTRLKDVFRSSHSELKDSKFFKECEAGTVAKYLLVVKFAKKEKSRNGNLYIKLELEDEVGNVDGILVDTARFKKCTEYLKDNKVPAEGNIVVVYGEKNRSGDALFLNRIRIIDEMIYMKLSDFKNDSV
ncbi:MAG: DNA polymerase III subunit alpha [Cellvibrionales bacterium]|jgi:DNA polymerase-3 subunit alpha|nr:DNA polymerase III subunit alpha [Cellvibrionales bacterium]